MQLQIWSFGIKISPYHTQWHYNIPTDFVGPWWSTRVEDDYLGYDNSCPLSLYPDTWQDREKKKKKSRNWWQFIKH